MLRRPSLQLKSYIMARRSLIAWRAVSCLCCRPLFTLYERFAPSLSGQYLVLFRISLTAGEREGNSGVGFALPAPWRRQRHGSDGAAAAPRRRLIFARCEPVLQRCKQAAHAKLVLLSTVPMELAVLCMLLPTRPCESVLVRCTTYGTPQERVLL